MVGTGTNSTVAADLLVELDRSGGPPLHRQLADSIRSGIRAGRLPRGSALPASRALAADLGLSRGVVVEAYQQLVAEGYLVSRPGGYTRVAAGPEPVRAPPPPGRAPAPLVDFGYGRTDPASFPRTIWLRSLRRVLTTAPHDRLGYTDGRGLVELREALASYLNRVRGCAATPDQVVVTHGFGQAAALLTSVLAARGATRIAVEDPSPDDDVRLVARAAGLQLVPVPVDEAGVRTDALERVDADALVLTPSHQWPTGAVLSAERRAAVVAWARDRGALVVEDDYDAEYRYDRAPIGAMQGLAPDVVAYAGSASKTLAAGLRLGWLVLPPDLVEEVAAAKLLADRGSPALDQLALADFLTHGELDRHLRRMRPVYRRRRAALLDALATDLPQLTPSGIAAGLHLVAWLPPGLDEQEVVAAALRAGVRVAGVTPYRMEARGPGGLVFGYSALGEDDIRTGVRLIRDALERELSPAG